MADAVPVHSNKKPKAIPAEVIIANPTGDEKADKAAAAALHARALEIVESEVPVVPDELVNSLGQSSSYGKFQRVSQVPYDVIDRKGEPTGEVRHTIRIDH